MLPVNQKDLESLQEVLDANGFEKPNLKISIYKNRRGKYKGIYLWCKANLGVCRIKTMFLTTWSYEIVEAEDIQIRVERPMLFSEEGE